MLPAPSRIYSSASRHVSTPPIALRCMPASSGFCPSSVIKRRAMGFTAFPLYPPTADMPCTAGAETYVWAFTAIILLMVLMAAIPFAPPRFAASAAGLIFATFGVSLARIGIDAPRRAAAVNRSTSSGTWPMSEPRPLSAMFGHEKFSSIASAPFLSHWRARSSHSASFCPMMEARMNLVG